MITSLWLFKGRNQLSGGAIGERNCSEWNIARSTPRNFHLICLDRSTFGYPARPTNSIEAWGRMLTDELTQPHHRMSCAEGLLVLLAKFRAALPTCVIAEGGRGDAKVKPEPWSARPSNKRRGFEHDSRAGLNSEHHGAWPVLWRITASRVRSANIRAMASHCDLRKEWKWQRDSRPLQRTPKLAK